MKLINELLMFILMISKKYNIDESHDISHSMDVLHFANDIYEQQVYLYPPLKDYKNVIQICALLHDMCDKKLSIYIPIYSTFIIICYSFMVHSFHKAIMIMIIK